MEEPRLVMEMELDSVRGAIARAVQRCIDLVGFGLNCTESAKTVPSLELPNVSFGLETSWNTKLTVETVRAEFRVWILQSALKEAIESVGASLESARGYCEVARRIRLGSLHISEIPKCHHDPKFHGMGLPAKIDSLRGTYGFTFASSLLEKVISINAARNCLVHRRGVVGDADVDDGSDTLSVKWRRVQSYRKSAEQLEAVTFPAHLSAGESLVVGPQDVTKAFVRGVTVDFTLEEFVEICFTLFLFGHVVQRDAVAYLKTKDVQIGRVEAEGRPPVPKRPPAALGAIAPTSLSLTAYLD